MANDAFMRANTKMGDYIDKEKALHERMGTVVAEAIVNRIEEVRGISKSLDTDLDNLVADLPDVTKAEVFKQALIAITKHYQANGKSPTQKKKHDTYQYEDMFSKRGF